jgi:hypothetical protein
MKQRYGAALIMFVLGTTMGSSAQEDNKTTKKTLSPSQQNSFLTPQKGSLVRKNILDTLRNEIIQTQGVKAVFVVKYLKATKDWAWVHVLPQSPDGINHYEDISALLYFQHGKWKIAELPCTEPENPECIDSPNYFMELKKRFPQLPGQILPEK